MTQREKDLLWSWLINEELRLAQSVHDLTAALRTRPVSYEDCLYLAYLKQRHADFKDFRTIVIRLLDLDFHGSDCF